MNKVFLIGNLTRDPEISETRSGATVCHFSIAVNRAYTGSGGERQTDFFTCTAWNGAAEAVGKYCSKGSKVAVAGSIQLRNYEDNQSVKRTAVDIIVQDVEFLTPRENGHRDYYDESRAAGQKGAQNSGRKSVLQSFDDDGDIPF